MIVLSSFSESASLIIYYSQPVCIYQKVLALNNPQRLIYLKRSSNQPIYLSIYLIYVSYLSILSIYLSIYHGFSSMFSPEPGHLGIIWL